MSLGTDAIICGILGSLSLDWFFSLILDCIFLLFCLLCNFDQMSEIIHFINIFLGVGFFVVFYF